MREVDPIREPAETLLSSALHRLARTGERAAPPELGLALTATFRQHHRRRRMTKMALAGAIAASIVIAVLLLAKLRPAERPQIVQKPAVQQEQQVVSQQPAPASTLPQKSQRYAVVRGSRQIASIEQSSMANAFIPLPAYDSAIGVTDVRVVRMEVTGSDLMMVGAPVSAELADNRMLADFVVGSDGTPYAVRLVQQ